MKAYNTHQQEYLDQIGYRNPTKATSMTYTARNAYKQGLNDIQGTKGGIDYVYPKEIHGMDFAPFLHGQDIGNLLNHFTDVGNKVRHNKKAPYYGGFNPIHREPGNYPLGKPGPQGYGNQVERADWTNTDGNIYEYPADLLDSLGILERQMGEANMPHQWTRPAIELDQSQRNIAEFFSELASRELQRKVQDLEAKGYSPEEIRNVIMDMRRKDIEKQINRPSHAEVRYEDIQEMNPSMASELNTLRREAGVQMAPAVRTRYRSNNGF